MYCILQEEPVQTPSEGNPEGAQAEDVEHTDSVMAEADSGAPAQVIPSLSGYCLITFQKSAFLYWLVLQLQEATASDDAPAAQGDEAKPDTVEAVGDAAASGPATANGQADAK